MIQRQSATALIDAAALDSLTKGLFMGQEKIIIFGGR
jgi:hypothetical protein